MPRLNSVDLFDLIKVNQLPPDVEFAYEDHSDGRREYFCPNCELSQWNGYNLDHFYQEFGVTHYTCQKKLYPKDKLLRWLRNG